MLRIHRYVLRSMLVPFLAGTTVFLAVIVVNTIIKQADEIFSLHAGFGTVARWLLLRVPFILSFALPVGVMLATSFTLMQLGRDNELTPMRLGGLSVPRLLTPFYLWGAVTSVGSLAIAEWVAPPCIERANAILAKEIVRQAKPMDERHATFKAPGDTFCHVSHIDMRAARMDFVLLYRFERGRPREALSAPTCVLLGHEWVLQHGQHSFFDESGKLARTETFETYPVAFPHNLVELWDEDKEPEQLTIRQTRARLKMLRAAGDAPDPTGEARSLVAKGRYYLHTKFSLPLTCLVFTLLAAPLTLRFARPQSSPFTGIFLTIVVVFFANGTINWAKVVTLAGWFAPPLGAWLHVAVFGLLALVLILRSDS